MKAFKKCSVLLLTAAMAGAMCSRAFAGTIKINNSVQDATYKVFQIFIGDVSDIQSGNSGTISNIKWGKSINTKGLQSLGNATDKAKEITDAEKASDFARLLLNDEYITTDGGYLADGDGNGNALEITKDEIVPGYYLIFNENVGDHALVVVGNDGTVEITPKVNNPVVEKKVQDKNDSESGGGISGWQDSADYDIGDTIPYQIAVDLPEAAVLKCFDVYSLGVYDTISKGLTLDKNSIKVYLDKSGNGIADGSDDDVLLTENTDYTLTVSDYDAVNGTKISLVYTDVKKIADIGDSSKLVMTYSASLNESSIIGSEGNPNTVKLVYPDDANFAYIQSEAGPSEEVIGAGDSFDREQTDKNTVFTYELDVKKIVKDTASALEGAGFTLKKLVGAEWQTVKSYPAGTATSFAFERIDDGIYQLVEDKAPDGYNKLDEPIYFEVKAIHDTESADPKLTSLTVTKGTWTDSGFTPISDDTTFSAATGASGPTGVFTTDVANEKGAVLPSTGGIGTRAVYLFGGILVIAALLLFVAKRCVGRAE